MAYQLHTHKPVPRYSHLPLAAVIPNKQSLRGGNVALKHMAYQLHMQVPRYSPMPVEAMIPYKPF